MLRQPGGGLGVRAKALADAHGFIVRIWCDSVGAAPRTRSTLRMNPGACARSSVNHVALEHGEQAFRHWRAPCFRTIMVREGTASGSSPTSLIALSSTDCLGKVD